MSRWWDEAKGFYRPENSNVRGNLIFTNSYRSKSFDFLQKLFIHFFNSVILHIFLSRQVFFAKILQLGGSGMKWKLCRVVFTAASILSPPSSPIFLSKLITRTRNCLPRDFERRKLLMIWKKVPQPAIWKISPRCCTSRRCSTSTRSSTSRRCEQHCQRGGDYHPIIPVNKWEDLNLDLRVNRWVIRLGPEQTCRPPKGIHGEQILRQVHF